MPFDAVTLAFLLLLGGWVAADSTGFAQVMISRPLVAATAAGWLAGSPAAGAAAGLILEVFHLTVLPVGAAQYPESGPAAVVVGALFAVSDQSALILLTALGFSLIWERVSAVSVRRLRQVNIRIISADDTDVESEAKLERRHLAALVLDAGRGVLLVLSGIVVLHTLISMLPGARSASDPIAAQALHLFLIFVLAGALSLFGRRLRMVAAGAVFGFFILLLRT
jgi:mannose/fructose/N-acetylgalactosamine-specific phosphotransferase system component IIC